MNTIQKLADFFSRFPGIGPRQSKRFVYFLLSKDKNFLKEISDLILKLKDDIKMCCFCYRYFPGQKEGAEKCEVCVNTQRDKSVLMIVEKDTDFENIEKNGVYKGLYFILGGVIPVLEKKPENKIRAKELVKRIEKDVKENGLKEIIFATSLSAEGENTRDFLNDLLKPIAEKNKIKISTLGRGLSTGTELEYIDLETIKNALKNRI